MRQHGIETILMRRLASQLTMPILLVDPRGDLVYFNEAAGAVLGRRYEDTGAIVRGEWSSIFQPANPDGSPIKREELPLFVATERQLPSHRNGWIRGLDGVTRGLESIAFPLVGQGERMLGAVGMFWDPAAPPPAGAAATDGPIDLASPSRDRPVELLLMRQLASYLKTAIFLTGPDGSLLFFNEPAENLLGRRFEEFDPMTADEWSTLLQASDESGVLLSTDERPMVIALTRQLPVHKRFAIRGFDGVSHRIEGLAFPLVGRAAAQLGAVGIFWEHFES